MYAEEVNYWQTSGSGPDKWIERAKKQISQAGGEVLGEGFLSEPSRSAFMLAFKINDDTFKMVWPILAPKKGNLRAARVQAATALYHEVKAASVKAKFLGSRTAFFAYYVLPDGRAASEVGTPELVDLMPNVPLLQSGESLRGELS